MKTNAMNPTMTTMWLAALVSGALLACDTNEEREPGTDASQQPDTEITTDAEQRPDVPDTGTDVEIQPDVETPDGGSTDIGECILPEPEQHRPSAAACSEDRAPAGRPEGEGADWSSCTTDAECTEGTNGRCTGNSHDGWQCTYDQCFADDECGGSVCACDGGWRSGANVCLGGDCQTDADCGEGGFCSPSYGDCGEYGGVVAYYCHTCEDECYDDSDCGEDPNGWGGPGYCMFNPTEGHWMCGYQQCAG